MHKLVTVDIVRPVAHRTPTDRRILMVVNKFMQHKGGPAMVARQSGKVAGAIWQLKIRFMIC